MLSQENGFQPSLMNTAKAARFLLPASRCPRPATRFLLPATRYALMASQNPTWNLEPGTWNLEAGSWKLETENLQPAAGSGKLGADAFFRLEREVRGGSTQD